MNKMHSFNLFDEKKKIKLNAIKKKERSVL